MVNTRTAYNFGVETGSSSAFGTMLSNNTSHQVSYSIGEIHLHEVQNIDELSKAIKSTFLPTLNQQLYKNKL